MLYNLILIINCDHLFYQLGRVRRNLGRALWRRIKGTPQDSALVLFYHHIPRRTLILSSYSALN